MAFQDHNSKRTVISRASTLAPLLTVTTTELTGDEAAVGAAAAETRPRRRLEQRGLQGRDESGLGR